MPTEPTGPARRPPLRLFALIFTGLLLIPGGFFAGNYLHARLNPSLPPPTEAASREEEEEVQAENEAIARKGEAPQVTASDVFHSPSSPSSPLPSRQHTYATAEDVDRATRRAFVERELGSVRAKLEQLRVRRGVDQTEGR